jgi:hypothetical protein
MSAQLCPLNQNLLFKSPLDCLNSHAEFFEHHPTAKRRNTLSQGIVIRVSKNDFILL